MKTTLGKKSNTEIFKLAAQLKMVKVWTLLKNGADINELDEDGESIITKVAASKKRIAPRERIEIMKKLILKGADINLEGKNGDIAINYALSKDEEETVEFLLKNGSNRSFHKTLFLISKCYNCGAQGNKGGNIKILKGMVSEVCDRCGEKEKYKIYETLFDD